MKRAAVVMTDAPVVWVKSIYESTRQINASEQLLADLRTVLEFAETHHEVARPAARVRAAIGDDE